MYHGYGRRRTRKLPWRTGNEIDAVIDGNGPPRTISAVGGQRIESLSAHRHALSEACRRRPCLRQAQDEPASA